jgi:hypothetical protein
MALTRAKQTLVIFDEGDSRIPMDEYWTESQGVSIVKNIESCHEKGSFLSKSTPIAWVGHSVLL